MVLLHYMNEHAAEFGISLCALNCDHRIRGEASARDSAFVKGYCKEHGIPLLSFVWKDYKSIKKSGLSVESFAREWRRSCYCKAMEEQTLPDGTRWEGADAIATAHHMNDNAETVLFNLARGSALAGMKGITDGGHTYCNGEKFYLIHPLIECTRAEIDAYIGGNNVPYVEDESNGTDEYTRNYIRHNVIPALENAVPAAVKSIYRFSRIAAEDEEYFDNLIEEKKLVKSTIYGGEIAFCKEKPVFKRAVLKALYSCCPDIKDYTSEHMERLYNLQFAENGKKFEFLNLVAFKEEGKIALCDKTALHEKGNGCLFCDWEGEGDFFFGQYCIITAEEHLEKELQFLKKGDLPERYPKNVKPLKFDFNGIPKGAVIRFMKKGDKFTKFGGGTKNLGDYFTDKKIPVRLRGKIPLIAKGSEVLAVCGVEISDKIKITEKTDKIYCIICADYARIK